MKFSFQFCGSRLNVENAFQKIICGISIGFPRSICLCAQLCERCTFELWLNFKGKQRRINPQKPIDMFGCHFFCVIHGSKPIILTGYVDWQPIKISERWHQTKHSKHTHTHTSLIRCTYVNVYDSLSFTECAAFNYLQTNFMPVSIYFIHSFVWQIKTQMENWFTANACYLCHAFFSLSSVLYFLMILSFLGIHFFFAYGHSICCHIYVGECQ